VRLGRVFVCISTTCLILFLASLAWAQAPPASMATVPRLIRITGAVRDETGKPLSASTGITFTLYKEEDGQEAVWQETQNLKLDSAGRFSVLLGATNEEGLPLEIFSAGEARWLGVRPDGQGEQPRILLLSVAYALKAADSAMLGGKPASAFVLRDRQPLSAQPASGAQAGWAHSQNSSQVVTPDSGVLPLLVSPTTSCASITSDGSATVNQIAKFTSLCNIENSAIFESGGNVGIGNTTPSGALDVSGTAFIRGSLNVLGGAVLAPVQAATPAQGYASNPVDIEASVYNTSISAPVNYIFRWQADPVGNDSSNSGATLNLLYGVNGLINQTGLFVAGNGILTFATGQTFPGVGKGTVTKVDTGAGLTGGPITTTGTISIPTAGVSNAMLANSSVKVLAGTGLSGGGTVALGGTITLTSNLAGTQNGMAYFSSPTNLTSTPAPTDGQILIGSTGKAPVLGTLTAGQNITIKNKPGSVIISAAGGSGSPTLPFFVTGGEHTGVSQAAVQNATRLWGFLLPYNVTTTQLTYDVVTADNTAHNYDIGIFNTSGNLVVDLGPAPGPTFSPSKGFHTLRWTQGSTSLAAGRYYLAFTTNCSSSCAQVAAVATFVSFAINLSGGTSAGGALPSSMTPPADTWGTGNQPTVVIQ
jgi:hypothetical protein